MTIEDPYVMAYTVGAESWHRQPGSNPDIMISKLHPDGGCDWQFPIRQVSDIGIRAEIFDDAWHAFAEVPELFATLAALGGDATLNDVRATLDHLGYVDTTERTRPDQGQLNPLRPWVERIVGRLDDNSWRALNNIIHGSTVATDD